MQICTTIITFMLMTTRVCFKKFNPLPTRRVLKFIFQTLTIFKAIFYMHILHSDLSQTTKFHSIFPTRLKNS